MIFKAVGPKWLLPIVSLLWGLTSTCQSRVSSYSVLLACRFFIGFFEGGLFPCIVLYLTDFYRPHELQTRIGLFFPAAALSGAFSGLRAAAIEQMEGDRGMHGWQVRQHSLIARTQLTACSGSFCWKEYSPSASHFLRSGSYRTHHLKSKLSLYLSANLAFVVSSST